MAIRGKKGSRKIVANTLKQKTDSGLLIGLTTLSKTTLVLSVIAAAFISISILLAGVIIAGGVEIEIMNTDDINSLHAGEGNIETHNYNNRE